MSASDHRTNDLRNEPAYPSQPRDGSGAPACAPNIGLSKRELFAAMAMQGLIAADRRGCSADHARTAVDYADTLLSALEQTHG